MEFRFETQYTAKTMTVMAKALRKTVRKKHSRRSHRFGWLVIALAALLLWARDFILDFRTAATLIVVLAILISLLFEDSLNGYFAQKRLLPGTEKAESIFSESSFISTTQVGTSQWNYDKITLVVETQTFFIFIFSANHAQLYDKRTLQGGSPEDFRRFIEEVTGKAVQNIS